MEELHVEISEYIMYVVIACVPAHTHRSLNSKQTTTSLEEDLLHHFPLAHRG